MTVEASVVSVVYNVTRNLPGEVYDIIFNFIEPEYVKAYSVFEGEQTHLRYGIDYTITEKKLTVAGVLPVNTKLVIYRVTDITQEILWVDGQAINAPDIMKADDKLTQILQEFAEQIDRTIKVKREDTAATGMSGDELLQDIFKKYKEMAEAKQEIADYEKQIAQSLADIESLREQIRTSIEGAQYAEYSIPIKDATGRVHVVLADLKHPEMKNPFNPIININAPECYTYTLIRKNLTEFVIQIFDKNGEKKIPFSEAIPFNDFVFGDDVYFGQGGETNVSLYVSIPYPPLEEEHADDDTDDGAGEDFPGIEDDPAGDGDVIPDNEQPEAA